jgi:ABC-type antimicrobial peptide transport system permease subunit
VSQRAAEIGVRMAIGASPANVVGLVVRQGAVLAFAGIVIGLIGAAAAAQAVQSLLFVEARGFDPLTFAGSALILVIAALAASYVPARRAARVSPVSALGR